MFRKLEMNMPFFEALEQMPMYQKFMKEIMGDELATLTEKCDEISQGR